MPTPLLERLLPKSVAGWCFVAIVAGVGTGLFLGERSAFFSPLGEIFTRAYSLTILPYLLFEVIGTFGSLRKDTARTMIRHGLLPVIVVIGIGAASIPLLALVLPPLISSPLFDPAILESPVGHSLIHTFLPTNIFSALTVGNIPAVLVFSIVVGIALQGLKNREPILNVLTPIRKLFRSILSFIAKRIAPFGIFAFTASTVGSSDAADFQRVFGLVAMLLTGFIVIGLFLLPALILGLTRFSAREVWGALRDPFVLAVTTANPLLTLPVLIENLKKLFLSSGDPSPEAQSGFEAIEALAPICLVFLGVGRIVVLAIIPFIAWYYDSPMGFFEILGILPSAIASGAGGVQLAVLQELPRLGLPTGLLSLYLMNKQWVDLIKAALSVLGMGAIAFLLQASVEKKLEIRPSRFVGFLIGALIVGLALGGGSRVVLGKLLAGSARGKEIILNQRSIASGPVPVVLDASAPPDRALSTLDAIRERNLLRAGVRKDTVPWVYRNALDELVGYDVDLLKSFADSLGVELVIVEGNETALLKWLEEGRVDCIAGGFHATGLRGNMNIEVAPYESVNIAVVVPDDSLRSFQKAISADNRSVLRFGFQGQDVLSYDLQKTILHRISGTNEQKRVKFVPIQEQTEFLEKRSEVVDALIMSAQTGAGFAVVHPELTMIPAFGNDISSDVVLVFAADNDVLFRFATDWILENQNLDLFDVLWRHWILFKPAP